MKNITTFDEHLDQKYGERGTKNRTDFEIKAKSFAIGEILREARKEANLTQEELAKKTGTGKVSFHELKMDIAISNYQHFIK